MQVHVKRFSELTTDELYDILKLRVSVFVVEQQCAYMEIDDMDQDAIHIFLTNEEGIQAYLRVMNKTKQKEHVSIGRVIAKKRRMGLGTKILTIGIQEAEKQFHADRIYLEAQTYAIGLYEKQGFETISEEFLEDGIPHVKMLRIKNG